MMFRRPTTFQQRFVRFRRAIEITFGRCNSRECVQCVHDKNTSPAVSKCEYSTRLPLASSRRPNDAIPTNEHFVCAKKPTMFVWPEQHLRFNHVVGSGQPKWSSAPSRTFASANISNDRLNS